MTLWGVMVAQVEYQYHLEPLFCCLLALEAKPLIKRPLNPSLVPPVLEPQTSE